MRPRANALGILIKNDFILLEQREGKHSEGIGTYYRPIGGTIEFGERSDDTLIREFKEELGVEINVLRYITCVENIFTVDNNIGHELSQVYLVEFADPGLYERDFFVVTESQQKTMAKWIAKEDIYSNSKTIYPRELRDLLKNY